MTMSTKPELRLDVCSACHPFFTGAAKMVNRGGRVEKFKNKYINTIYCLGTYIHGKHNNMISKRVIITKLRSVIRL